MLSFSSYVGNIAAGDLLLQITESGIRLLNWSGDTLSTWQGDITVANANDSGQIAVALRGGRVLYFEIASNSGGPPSIEQRFERQLEQEVSCIDVQPFRTTRDSNAMETDDETPPQSDLVAVGSWDDCTVRLFSIPKSLEEVFVVDLRHADDDDTNNHEPNVVSSPSRRNRNSNTLARSLCMVTMDYASSSSSSSDAEEAAARGVNMLFIGLGDGTLVSFAVVVNSKEGGEVTCQSKKEVCLGTQRIDLVPLHSEQGGSCVLATGDRPTVVYLAGAGNAFTDLCNPKLCYSSVNVSANEEEMESLGRPSSTQNIAVTVAAPFNSPLLDSGSQGTDQQYSLCVADEKCLRLGVIDDIQKLHVTTCRLGMSPRRIVYCSEARMFAVGCMESSLRNSLLGEYQSMGNCVRFLDDATFEDLHRVDMEPFEEILSMAYVSMESPSSVSTMADGNGSSLRTFLLVGTAYALPDEPEPTHGRVLVYLCDPNESTAGTRVSIRQVTEMATNGGVYSICQFYNGSILVSVNTRVSLCKMEDDNGVPKLVFEGEGHFGHILSLCVKSRATRETAPLPQRPVAAAASIEPPEAPRTPSKETTATKQNDLPDDAEMIAIVGDLSRSIGVLQYYAKHTLLEEVARDYNTNWICAVEMLTDHVYLGGEHWCNLFTLRRNTASSSEELRSRLDTIGEYNLGEMCNKFMIGSLVMPTNKTGTGRSVRRRTSPSKKNRLDSPAKSPSSVVGSRGPQVVTGSQTIFGTVDGTLGVIMGLDNRTAAFFFCLQRVMAKTIQHVGDFSHEAFRAYRGERRVNPSHGFVDGDLVESFLDLDYDSMALIVEGMNMDGGWDLNGAEVRSPRESEGGDDAMQSDLSDLTVEDVLAMVEEMTMLH